MKVTQLIRGDFGDTLLDVTPPRPGELKTSEDFRRDLENDRYPRAEILRDFRITAAELEDLINRRGFPRAVSNAGWSRSKVGEWRQENSRARGEVGEVEDCPHSFVAWGWGRWSATSVVGPRPLSLFAS